MCIHLIKRGSKSVKQRYSQIRNHNWAFLIFHSQWLIEHIDKIINKNKKNLNCTIKILGQNSIYRTPPHPKTKKYTFFSSLYWKFSKVDNAAAATAAKSLQLCPTLCDSMDCSPPGSSVHGIFQARVLEWVAIAFSEGR